MFDIHKRSELLKKYFQFKKDDKGKLTDEFEMKPEAKALLDNFVISPVCDLLTIFLHTQEDECRKQIEAAMRNTSIATNPQRAMTLLVGKMDGIIGVRQQFENWKAGRKNEQKIEKEKNDGKEKSSG